MGKIAGTPILKRVLPVAQRLEQAGADPVGVLIEMLSEKEHKFKAAEVLMKYVYPQLKAVEWTLKEVPDEVFDKEVERRIHLKIVRGEIDRNGNKIG